MKVTIIAPQWPNYHGLLCHIRDMVLNEGGDGWAWIVSNNYETIANDFIALLNRDVTIDKQENWITIMDNQESWTFSHATTFIGGGTDFIFKLED